MNEIIIPNVNNNETEVELVEWLVKDGENVKKGDIIASLETTKADVAFESEFDGKIKIISKVGVKYKVGTTVAYIFNSDSNIDELLKEIKTKENVDENFVITKPAKDFIIKHKINEAKVKSLGLALVKVKDLEKFIIKEYDFKIKFSPIQKTIANNVINSNNFIPDAFQLKKINVTETINSIFEFSKKNGFTFGLPELLIFSLSKLHFNFPEFYSKIIDQDFYTKSIAPNIGVTLDLGKGLFIPVLNDCDKMSIKEISLKLMEFKMKALRSNFKSDDFSNCNFTVSLNMDNDTVFVNPIIFPGQVCMLSINSVFEELVMENGEIIQKKYIYLGLAYDHRLINGYKANNFITELKLILEEGYKSHLK